MPVEEYADENKSIRLVSAGIMYSHLNDTPVLNPITGFGSTYLVVYDCT